MPPQATDAITATYGTRKRLSLRNTEGAFPSSAKPYSVRDAKNVHELPELKAEVRMTALISEGKACKLHR